MHPNPLFLFGISQRHQQNIRLRNVNPVQNIAVVQPRHVLLGGSIGAHDAHPRIVPLQQLLRPLGDVPFAAQKKNPIPLPR